MWRFAIDGRGILLSLDALLTTSVGASRVALLFLSPYFAVFSRLLCGLVVNRAPSVYLRFHLLHSQVWLRGWLPPWRGSCCYDGSGARKEPICCLVWHQQFRAGPYLKEPIRPRRFGGSSLL